MAANIWLGTTSDDWEVTTNWSLGTIPVNADTVVVPKVASNHIKTNLDRMDDTANAGLDLAGFIVEDGSPVEIGSSSNPLQIAADVIIHRGMKPFYLAAAEGSGSLFVDKLIVDSANLTDAMFCGGKGVSDDAAISRIVLTRGHTTLQAGLTVATPRLELSYVGSPSSDVACVIESGAAVMALINMNGGIMTSHGLITAAVMTAGFWTQDTQEIGILTMGGSSRMIYNTAKGGTAMSRAEVMGGTLDLTQTSDEREIDDVYVYRNGLFLRDESLFTGTSHDDAGGFAGPEAPGGPVRRGVPI